MTGGTRGRERGSLLLDVALALGLTVWALLPLLVAWEQLQQRAAADLRHRQLVLHADLQLAELLRQSEGLTHSFDLSETIARVELATVFTSEAPVKVRWERHLVGDVEEWRLTHVQRERRVARTAYAAAQ
ncbi:MAG: hypothetical protein AAF581_00545 [Planctomycetota bacterium]